jgi:rhodanese-related sulfurtransferase
MIKYPVSLLIFVWVLIVSSTATAQHSGHVPGAGEKTHVPFLTALMVKQEMEGSAKPVLIDVGSVQEYRGGHIPGAINVPSVAIKAQPQRLPKNKSTRIIIYYGRGESGQERAHRAATRVWNMGYTNVSVFMGGMADWVDAKYPVRKGPKP